MKKISLLLLSLAIGQMSFAKAVSEQSALTTGYNYLRTEGVQVQLPEMSLTYTATSVVNGQAVNDYYVFNTGNTGFIIIAGDDNVAPVLGYSTEGTFRVTDIPGSVADWLANYSKQINYTIANKQSPSVKVAAQWNELQAENKTKSAARTTAVYVVPFMKTKWDQAGYYNQMCPYDASADTNALTGCVATAMAQVMRFWKWPDIGLSSHTYRSSYGSLTADFSSTNYVWDSMPNAVIKANSYVATLMSHAGISVNMSYGVSSSGAYVTQGESPVTNCAEYALKTYFKYKNTLKGYSRYSFDDSDWIKMITFDLDNSRPVIHTGSGASGGHCFIIDGYNTGGAMLHVNWGWGGYYNGYYSFNNLAPSTTETFNNDETVIVGITPDNDPRVLSVNETATSGIAVFPNPVTDVINIRLSGTANKITLSDIQGRVLKTIAPQTNDVAIPSNDLTPGMYLVTIYNAAGTTTQKIVKE